MTAPITTPPHAPSTADGAEHASDELLFAAVDGELDAGARAALEAHLAGCARCRARDGALRADAALVASALAGDGVEDVSTPFGWGDLRRRAEAAPAVALSRTGHAAAHAAERAAARLPLHTAPARRVTSHRAPWRTAPWRAAAGLVLAAGAAAAAPRALRWASGRKAVAAAPAPAPPSGARGRADTVARAAGGSTVRFPLRGDTLRVAFDASQPAGELELVGGPGQADVTVDVRGGPGAARVLVLPDGVRVRNAPTSTASYRVTVPATVRAVRVDVGPRRLPAIATARLGAGAAAGVRVPLAVAP